MLMAIDVGNTNMVFGLLDGERLVGSFRLMTDANRTSDEIGLTVCEYFRRFDLTMDQVTDIIIASVVPQVMYTLTSAIIKYFGKKPIIIDEDVSTGIRVPHLGQVIESDASRFKSTGETKSCHKGTPSFKAIL